MNESMNDRVKTEWRKRRRGGREKVALFPADDVPELPASQRVFTLCVQL